MGAPANALRNVDLPTPVPPISITTNSGGSAADNSTALRRNSSSIPASVFLRTMSSFQIRSPSTNGRSLLSSSRSIGASVRNSGSGAVSVGDMRSFHLNRKKHQEEMTSDKPIAVCCKSFFLLHQFPNFLDRLRDSSQHLLQALERRAA